MLSITDNTIEKLTAGQLDRAAADLRNAALVAKHAGHFQGALVDRDTGAVCALGAIELATYKKLVKFDRDRKFYVSITTQKWVDNEMYRCENAVLAFADFVPTALCDLCDDEQLGIIHSNCSCEKRNAYDKVTHYNDEHCVSPELLFNLLNLAAENAELRAYERRHQLAARVLAGISA